MVLTMAAAFPINFRATGSVPVFSGRFAPFSVPDYEVLKRLGVNFDPVEHQLVKIVQKWFKTRGMHDLK